MKLDVISLAGKKAGSIDLDDAIYGLEPRADILHRMVRYQLAKRQAGTHKVKNRAEISRTGKKFGRQKGSGGARHGSRRAGIFVGGGRAFGPHPRSHAHDLPKKVRALALKHALSAKARDGKLVVVDSVEMKDAKTKVVIDHLATLNISTALFIDGATVTEGFARATRNVPGIDVLPVQGINVYDILRRDSLVLTKAAVEALEARFK